MNFKLKLTYLLGVSICVGGFSLTSCVDNESEVGLDLQNPEDKPIVFNNSTTSINTYTYQQPDTIYLNPVNMLLGYNIDAKLGEFQNNFMAEVGLSTLNHSFGDNPIADKMTLSLDYTFAYGDTTQEQTISVYELKKELSLHDPSNSIHGKVMTDESVLKYYDPILITSFTFTPIPSDTMPIKIVMPNSFRDRFLNDKFYTTQDTFQTNVFRGFYFVAEPTSVGGAISYINVGDSTRMELSYHNDTDTSTFTYNINSSLYRCNIFKRVYNSNINALPTNSTPDISKEQDLLYVKFNNAYEGRLEIAGLQTWADSGFITINKAVLDIYTEDSGTDSLYLPIPPLQVLRINNEQNRVFLIEYIGKTGYVKIPHDTLIGGYGYHININQTLNAAIQNGDDKLSLLLTTDKESNKSFANRVILKGALNTEQPIKLKITYTKLNIE